VIDRSEAAQAQILRELIGIDVAALVALSLHAAPVADEYAMHVVTWHGFQRSRFVAFCRGVATTD
jgi:hypothetical protein